MAPPGRRRRSASMLGMLFTLLLLAHSVCAQSAVLGIDLGTEYIKAALVKPGTPLEIVLAKDSKRQEASVVSFKPLNKGQIPKPEGPMPERSYGSAAIALAGRFPGDTYPNLKQLLGLPADSSSVVDRYQQRYPALSTQKADVRGTVAFQSPSFPPTERPFAVEELLAMELKNTIQNAQSMAGKAYKVSSAVFTVPPFYTTEEKAALELAAELAKIKVLAVITDGMAVGVNYATTRTFPSVSEGAKPEIHMVFDVGAGYTSATVLKMQSRTVKDIGKFNKTIQEVIVLGNGWDRTLGGDALNDLIVEDMATKFLETSAGKSLGKTVKDVLSHGRASTRLWKDAERVRQVLSANQETSASFEELYEGVDFRYKLSRPSFEAMSASIAERLDAPFTNALKLANVTIADLDSVIMHGGTIRTPFIQKRLEGLAGDASKLRSNVNSLEAAVFGAAFKAASVSPSFRVKDIRANDAATYPTWMQYRKDKEGKTTQQKVFSSSTFTGATKVYTLLKLEDFEIYLFQNRPTDKGSPYEAGKSGVSGSRFMSVNLTESVNKLVELGCKKEDVTTQVTLKLDSVWGLPVVHSGSVSCEHEVVEPKGVMDGVKDFLGFGKKEEGSQKVLDNDNESTESSSSTTPTGSATTSDSSSSASTSTSSAVEKDKPTEPSKPKQKTETLDFSFSVTHEPSIIVPYTEQKFMAERIRTFDSSDNDRRKMEEDRNNLESFIYKIRDYLDDQNFTPFASKPMIAEIETLMKSTNSWLSDDAGANADSKALIAKFKALGDLVDPIRNRKDEAARRPELTGFLKDALSQAKGLIDVIRDNLEAAKSVVASSSSTETSTSGDEASESSTTAAPSSSSTLDPLADLEEADESTSTTTTKSPKPSEEPFMAPYTESDLEEMQSSYDTVNTWLEGKLAEQDKLKEWEEPALISEELQKKAKELNDAVMNVLQKRFKPSSSRSKKSKPTKKPAKPKKKSTSSEPKTSTKDEL